MVNYTINPQKSALLVFDMSNDFLKPGAPRENPEARRTLVPRIKRLIEVCRRKGMPIVFTQHAHRENGADMGIMGEIWPQIKRREMLIEGTEGIQVYEELNPQKEDIIIKKLRYSAFFANELEMILKNRGVDTVIIVGATMNVGCESTARDATNRDFKVIFPSDGNLARDFADQGWGHVTRQEIEKVVLTTMATVFARVLTVDQLIAELE